jgi:hypothetical protein
LHAFVSEQDEERQKPAVGFYTTAGMTLVCDRAYDGTTGTTHSRAFFNATSSGSGHTGATRRADARALQG